METKHRPDYSGGGLLNLMSSLIQARGGRGEHPPLAGLALDDLTRATNLVLLVVDGLGADWLERHAPDGLLSRARWGAISSVFPSTTASAIPTYLTGLSPLQHGLTGWFTYFGELGSVMAVLPGRPRYGGVSYRAAGIDPRRLFPHRSIFDRIGTRGIAVSPRFIAYSDFNRAHLGRGEVRPFESLPEMFQQTLRVLRPRRRWGRSSATPERRYLYLYWPELDRIGHEHGMESAAALAHLAEIEQALEAFLSAAAGTDTVLLVCADHGQIDTRPEDVIDLAQHPELTACLTLPLCGEPRASWATVRADSARRFEDYCADELGDVVELIPSRQVIADGLLGPGPAHPRIRDRVGDYCLLPRARHVLRQALHFEEPHIHVGVHGGLSESELRVPLCLFDL
ncbi:alkaline phosphatase family protein [Allochromatium vinosum]|uniref:alkaline phosphatase family protein n=1 Tax=Allochromatium vinosum TaxID=1049 RepID=UPI001902CA2E|nr:alkaline phosphatase family protein [Allochromatium vinosum]MBK1653819.1 phosphodiesterase [Allochromatium vinosum]